MSEESSNKKKKSEHQNIIKKITSNKSLKKKSKGQNIPKKLTSIEALKKKYKELDLKNRQKINELTTDINSLTLKLERWAEDNNNLQKDNIELMDSVKTISTVIRGLMFNICPDCKTIWKMSIIKKMMKNLTIDCPGCDLLVQVK